MADEELLRVVVTRRGKVRPAEFRLRGGETGLSLFRKVESPGPAAIIEAVRAAGKQGELAVAEVPAGVIRKLGLRLVRTPGGTPDADVNELHVEARFPWWRRLVLAFRREPVHEYFNEHVTPSLAAAARLAE